jgi:hypothetical protein
MEQRTALGVGHARDDERYQQMVTEHMSTSRRC